MKKIAMILVAVSLIAVLASCGDKKPAESNADSSVASEVVSAVSDAASAETSVAA